jgi:hypothetical protein
MRESSEEEPVEKPDKNLEGNLKLQPGKESDEESEKFQVH